MHSIIVTVRHVVVYIYTHGLQCKAVLSLLLFYCCPCRDVLFKTLLLSSLPFIPPPWIWVLHCILQCAKAAFQKVAIVFQNSIKWVVKGVFGCCWWLGMGIPLMAVGGVSGVITVWHLEEKRLSTVISAAHEGPVVSPGCHVPNDLLHTNGHCFSYAAVIACWLQVLGHKLLHCHCEWRLFGWSHHSTVKAEGIPRDSCTKFLMMVHCRVTCHAVEGPFHAQQLCHCLPPIGWLKLDSCQSLLHLQ